MKLWPKAFLVQPKNGAVEKSWNLSDIMNSFEFCIFLLLRIALGTCLGVVLEILKFILILLLTYALALGVFHLMDTRQQESSKTFVEKNLKQNFFDLSKKNGGAAFPYLTTHLARPEEENFRFRSRAGLVQMTNMYSSDSSDDGIVHVGSFRRPAPAGEEGEMSIIGRALADLRNAQTLVNENQMSNAGSFHRAELD